MPPPKQIGADAGDDYSTIAGFLADVTSGSGIWSSGDDAIGEVHSDYADASEDIDFAVADQSNVSSVQVIGKSGQRHGGDPGGGGATFYAGGQKIAFTTSYTARTERIAWLEIDFESSASSTNDPVFGGGTSDYGREVDHCIVHSLTHNNWIRIGKRTDLFHNNLVFDITCSATFGAACLGIDISGDGKTTVFGAYNIVHNIGGANSAPFYRGVYGGNNASNTCKATIATDSDDTDFFNLGSSATGDNVSTDTTAPGTGSVTSATTSSLYASVAGLDFRPASASAPQVGIVASADKPSDAGASDFALDLEGNTRSSDTDAGAFEYQSAGSTVSVTGTASGVGTVSGTITVDRTITGTASGVGTVSGTIEVDRPITGAAAGVGTVSGAVDVARELTGTAAGVGTLSGAIDVSSAIAFTGTASGVGTVSGTIEVDRPITGAAAGVGTVSGALAPTRALAGTIAGVGALSGSVDVARELAGTVAGVGTLSGAIDVTLAPTIDIAGTIAGAGSLSAPLAVARPITGAFAGLGAVAGAILVTRGLGGVVAGVATLSGPLTIIGLFVDGKPVLFTIPHTGRTFEVPQTGRPFTIGGL